MDLAGGGLCYAGIAILHGCETGGVKYFRGSILPCMADLQWVAKIVEAYAHSLIPFTLGYLPSGGEFIERPPGSTVKLALKAYGLDEIAKV